jgi:adenylate cyclase
MTNVLIDNKGTLDKYIGDAIVAFYGAPIEIEDHEYMACKTALQMEKQLGGLRDKWKSEGDKWPSIVHSMHHRIGINAGNIVVGNMGSEMKLNYTMTGDQVNLTARLESSAKQLGIVIQVGENIYNKVSDKFIFRDLGRVIVVGRNQSLNTYELICEIDEQDDETSKLLEYFHKGLEYYHNQKWDKAISSFEKANQYEKKIEGRKTNPSLVFIERTKIFREQTLPADWDGVYSLVSK